MERWNEKNADGSYALNGTKGDGKEYIMLKREGFKNELKSEKKKTRLKFEKIKF
jgi:hypothetical protein